MKIKKVRVDWMDGWSNNPRFEVFMEGELNQPPNGIPWEERSGHFRREVDDLVDFLYWTAPGEGFGGRTFSLLMADGTIKELKGPWSSNSSSLNRKFPDRDPCFEVSYTTEPDVWERGHTFYAGAVKVEAVLEYLRANDWMVEVIHNRGSLKDLPITKGMEKLRVGLVKFNEHQKETWFAALSPDGTPKTKDHYLVTEFTI